MEQTTPELDRHDHVLLGLVMNVQATAMVQMGKMTDPTAGGIQRDLGAARISIDILEALQAKCKGNLSTDVAGMLDRAVMELQLNYTDEVKRSEEAEETPDADAPAAEDGNGSEDAEA